MEKVSAQEWHNMMKLVIQGTHLKKAVIDEQKFLTNWDKQLVIFRIKI